MKKSLLIISALMLSISAFAQWGNDGQGFQRPDEATMIKMRTERTAKELGLNEAQTAKLLELNQKYPNVMMFQGMGGPGGPGMGRDRGGRPDEANVDQEGNGTDKAAAKKAKKAKKNKKDNDAEVAQPEENVGRPERGRPGMGRMSEEQIKEMQANREAYENELKEILTEDQYNTWKENLNKRPQGRPGGFGPGGPGGRPGGFGGPGGGPGGFGGGDNW